MEVVLGLVAGYLLGAVPFAVLIARAHGVDIFQAGSGNPGATNVKRVLGQGPGNLCFALDFLKGFAAAGWPLLAFGGQTWPAVAGLLGAILGHSYSVFIGFRGGKGVASTMGGLLAVMPLVVVAGLLTWVAVFYLFRYVSLASIVFGLSLPVFCGLFWPWLGDAWPRLLVAVVLGLLIAVRHHSNIRKLLAGTEHKWVKKTSA